MKKCLAAYIALAVLLGICLAASDAFRNPANLMNIARQVSYSGIIALGMTLVIAGGGIDLSSGSLVAFCGVFALGAMRQCAALPAGAQLAVMLATALLCGVAGGAVNGALVSWGRIPPFIATLGTLSIFRSLAVYQADAGLVMADNVWLDRFCGGWTPVIVLLAVAGALAHLLRNTPLGWRICAVGASERASAYAALGVRRVRFTTYAIIGGLCGASAFLLAGRLSSISSTGSGAAYELDAIAAVILGGTSFTGGVGSIWGTLIGALIIQTLTYAIYSLGVPPEINMVVKAIVVFGVCLIQSPALRDLLMKHAFRTGGTA